MTLTLKIISDKIFVINFHGYADMPTDAIEHLNLKWSLRTKARSTADTPFKNLTVSLHCKGQRSYKVHANIHYALIKNDLTLGMDELAEDVCFTRDDFATTTSCEIYKDDFHWKYRDELGRIRMQCYVEITSMSGIQEVPSFQVKDELSDVALIVEGRKLHVNKAVLATFSPVFRQMFFKESTADEIVINHFKYDNFQQFLQVIHSAYIDINEHNVQSLLVLADRYDVEIVVEKCEKFLISTDKVSFVDKLVMAEKYDLVEVFDKYLKTKKDYQKACIFMHQLGPIVLRRIMKKFEDSVKLV